MNVTGIYERRNDDHSCKVNIWNRPALHGVRILA